MSHGIAVAANAGRWRQVLTATLTLGVGLIAPMAGAQTTWGGNYFVSHFPTDIAGIADISASNANIGVIQYGGKVRCWGEADDNQNIVPAGLKAKKLSAGQYYFAAVTTDGHVVCWGNNGFHQCDVPSGLSDVTSVATGYSQVVALKTDGTTVAWGGGGSPTVPSKSNIKQVAAFAEHYVFVDRNGRVFDDSGLIGSNAKYAAAGDYHTVILHPNGTVSCSGEDGDGQCDVPSGLNNVVQVAAGEAFSMALKSDGTVVCWGANESGQTNVPSGLSGVTKIAAGSYFGVAVKTIQISVDPRIIGGQSGIGSIILTDKAPVGGLTLSLTSNDALVTVPSTVTVPEGLRTASFTYDAGVPVSDTDVTFTATDTVGSATATIRVTTPSVSAFVNVDTFVGGSDKHIVLEIDVPSPATAGGLPVTLSSDDASITVPATATIRNGQTSVRLVLDHDRVHANTDVTITYSIPGVSNSLTLHLKPFEVQKMYFTPSEIIGDQNCQLQIVLNAEPKNFGSITVALSSSNPSVLSVPATVTTMGQNGFVMLTTNAVHRIWIVTATATLDGSQKRARITIDP